MHLSFSFHKIDLRLYMYIEGTLMMKDLRILALANVGFLKRTKRPTNI
jgi:hypothetical protein